MNMFKDATVSKPKATGSQEIICACGCGRKRMVRIADINRGWGKFYSKSCKARAQERATGQYAKLFRTERFRADQWEYGGIPQYNRGEYEGFVRMSQEPWDDHKGDND